jgi:hypothetical protein
MWIKGTWLRVHTNSIRGSGSSTAIGQVVEVNDKEGTVRIHNATLDVTVPLSYVIADFRPLDVDLCDDEEWDEFQDWIDSQYLNLGG